MAVRKHQLPATWPVAEAKERLDDVIVEAEEAGPQALVRHGEEDAVVVPSEEWDTHPALQGTLAEFFHRSGLGDVDLDITRHPDTVADLRDLDF